jgi:predicted Zn-dependent protease
MSSLARLADKPDQQAISRLTTRMEKNHGDFCKFAAQSVAKTGLKDKIALLESYAALVQNDQEITHWSASYSDSHISKEFYSSFTNADTGLKFDTQTAGLRLGVRFGSGANVFSETWCKAETSFDQLKQLHEEAKKYIEQARDYFHRAENIEGGVYTMLTAAGSRHFCARSFCHKSEADFKS